MNPITRVPGGSGVRAGGRGLALAVMLSACAGEDVPAEVAGSYPLTITTDNNGCALESFKAGEMTMGKTILVLAQDAMDKSKATGEVTGVQVGSLVPAFRLLFSKTTLTGTVKGASINLTVKGTTTMQAGCTSTVRADLAARATSPTTIEGSLTYRFDTDGADVCGTKKVCFSKQSFSGSK